MKRLLLLLLLVLIAAAVLMLLRRWLMRGKAEQRPAPFDATGAAAWLLFLLPLPVAAAAAVSLARGQFLPFLGDTLGYGLLLGAALLIRRGLGSAATPGGRRRPLTTLGSALAGLGTGLTAWLGIGHPPAIAVAFGLVALAGCLLTFGIDLAAGRRPRGIGEHAWTTLAEAGRAIAGIEQAARDIRQPELATRLERITALAREILARIEDEPSDLRRARRFLNVYLDGVQRVVEGYAKTHGRTDAPHLDQRFRHALVTVEDAFREQRQVLLERDIEDLDVQIEVLTRQLEREGIL
jgi:hypothetical protein